MAVTRRSKAAARRAPSDLRVLKPLPVLEAQTIFRASADVTPLDLWRDKLDFLQKEEAKSADPEQKFSLKMKIKDAQDKIVELGGTNERFG